MATLEEIAKGVHDSEVERLNAGKKKSAEEDSKAPAKPPRKADKPKKKEEPAPEPEEEDDSIITDDDDVDEDYEAKVTAPSSVEGPAQGAIASRPITMEDLKEMMPRIGNVNDRDSRAAVLYDSLQSYRKKIMIENGLTAEEADQAVRKRANREATKLENEWVDANPHTGVINIDKDKADDLQLTEEEHAKLVPTKMIRLNLIESQDIKTIKTKRLPAGTNKLDYIRRLNTMSNATVVLPMLGDIVTFKGATASEIVSSHLGDNDVEQLDYLSYMMPFIYNHYVDGHVIHKFDDQGKIILSYEDFCDQFPFYDADLALYGIFKASASPTYSLTLSCPKCHKSFPWTMVPDRMFRPENLTKEMQDKINEILAHSTDPEWLSKNSEESMKATMWESPETKNRFLVQTPSVSRAITVLRALTAAGINQSDNPADMLVAGNCMMLAGMFIYDADSDEYIEFTDSASDTEEMVRSLPSLFESDFNLITRFAQSRFYSADFNSGDIVCPHCNTKTFYGATPVDLLFRHAQESFQELQ